MLVFNDDPLAGRYDPAQGGMVKFGQKYQDNQKIGHKSNSTDKACRGRNMYVIVSNIANEPARIL